MYSVPNPEELREWMKEHDLTGAAAGKLVGVDARAVRRWTAPIDQAGHRSIPWAAWALLRVLEGAATIEEIRAETSGREISLTCGLEPSPLKRNADKAIS